MSRLGSYEVYKPDTKTHINPKVLDAVALARLTKNSRDYIDCMYGGKSLSDIRKDKDTQRIEERKKDLGERENV